jgi:hypothetical protein
MRNELEQIERIVAYLGGQFSAVENQAFEKEMAETSALNTEVNIQRELMEGVKRKALKREIQSAKSTYRKYKVLKAVAATVVLLGLVAGALWIFGTLNKGEKNTTEEKYNSEESAQVFNEEEALPLQTFEINTKSDTILETRNGIVFAIPSGAFNTSSERVKIEVREALTPSEIMKAGLSTTSGDELLETGGMFSFDGFANGTKLEIQKEIIAEIPTTETKAGMQLFSGIRKADGSLDWQNPKPLETYLNPVDVMTLDFYPPNYISGLNKLGKDSDNKSFTDSLYYSLEVWEAQANTTSNSQADVILIETQEEILTEQDEPSEKTLNKENKTSKKSPLYKTPIVALDSGLKDTILESATAPEFNENDRRIMPSQIRSIWNTKFNGSTIATKEFEERLKAMHQYCSGGALLNMYLNNLDKNLYELDSMAYLMTANSEKIFLKFARQRKGKTRPNNGLYKKLQDYYLTNQKIYADAAVKARKDYLKKNEDERLFAEQKNDEHGEKLQKIKDSLFAKEFAFNVKEAYRQLGRNKKTTIASGISTQRYTGSLSSGGWKNVDQYVRASTMNRTTLNYTDENGKKAVIEYKTASFTVQNEKEYDRIYVYAIPKTFNSFVRMKRIDNEFTYNLNELIDYDLVAIGYKGESLGICIQKEIHDGSHTLSLETKSSVEADKILSSFSKTNLIPNLSEELNYLRIEVHEQTRSKTFTVNETLRRNILPYVFPCLSPLNVNKGGSIQIESLQ